MACIAGRHLECSKYIMYLDTEKRREKKLNTLINIRISIMFFPGIICYHYCLTNATSAWSQKVLLRNNFTVVSHQIFNERLPLLMSFPFSSLVLSAV